ncbi:Uncharacterized protein dnl_05400 [Desulfonema limicola]|uniref:Uncharacterized protein n=1 Tax=Desulfonema limicola TaxID=45656 RepID=A0A975B3W0_9BACT|nr:hypothetical protein [Desulfonema limicola]QTA78319.1 Uncharacterized protein dnl_05400 [Desulfonema limicola]
MLSKIIIINSEIYSKAVIVLDRPSIQLVANNNTGKSSFINTLNFLFIINEKRMDFGDYEWKQTITHYFPRFNESYILFEIFKSKTGYYCILVKRTEDNVEYYIIEREWSFLDRLFFTENNEVMNFRELQKTLLVQNIKYNPLNKEQLFDKIYSRDMGSDAVLWITDNVKRKGRSIENSFTRIYRYLINSKLITPDALQDALIIADNRQNETLTVFADSSKKDDIAKLHQYQEEIEKLKSMQADFEKFKLLTYEYSKKIEDTGKLYSCFEKLYQIEEKYILDKREELIINQKETQRTIDEKLEPLKETTNREIGILQFQIQQNDNFIKQKEKALKEIDDIIRSFVNIEFALLTLQQKFDELNERYNNIKFQLDSTQKYHLSLEQIKNNLKKLKTDCSKLYQQKNNFDNLLKYHISADENIQLLLNTILSENISNLTKEKIISPVTKISGHLELYDGKIDISDINIRQFETITDIEEQISDHEHSIAQKSEIVEFIQNRNEKEKEVKIIEGDIHKIKDKIEKINQYEYIERELQSAQIKQVELKQQLQEKEIELEIISSDIKKHYQAITKQSNEIINIDSRHRMLGKWFNDIHEDVKKRGIPIFPASMEKEGIEKLYNKLRANLNEILRLHMKINDEFVNLKNKLDNHTFDIQKFIIEVDENIATISEKEKSIEVLLENISNQFTTPVNNYLQRYSEFKSFIKSFNKEISQYQISNIEQIEIELKDARILIYDLEKISKIRKVINFNQRSLFDEEQTDALDTLNRYLSKSEKYPFNCLFDIFLYLTIHGKRKKVDLGRQVESEGTDKTLKLILFMMIMKRFVVSDDENRIVVFVDEVLRIDDNNVGELMRFCIENNFLPICAAKSQAIGIEKFYFLQPSVKNQNKIFVDKEIQTAIAIKRNV